MLCFVAGGCDHQQGEDEQDTEHVFRGQEGRGRGKEELEQEEEEEEKQEQDDGIWIKLYVYYSPLQVPLAVSPTCSDFTELQDEGLVAANLQVRN